MVKIVSNNESSISKNLKKFSSNSEELTQILTNCFKNEDSSTNNLSDNEKNFLKLHSISDSLIKEINSFKIEKLLEIYTFSLSKRDQIVLKRIYELDPNLNCLLFKSTTETTKITDFINLKLNEDITMITTTIQNYPINRKIEDFSND